MLLPSVLELSVSIPLPATWPSLVLSGDLENMSENINFVHRYEYVTSAPQQMFNDRPSSVTHFCNLEGAR